jgi:nitrite reductase/ring-hydroxylating ferredoxin subunit
MSEVLVCRVNELPDGGVRIVAGGDAGEIGVYRQGGHYYAYRNRCIHQGGPVCEGEIVPQVEDVLGADRTWQGQRFNNDDLHIVCPWHSYEFHLKTGVCVTDATQRLKSYEVVERNGAIYVVV